MEKKRDQAAAHLNEQAKVLRLSSFEKRWAERLRKRTDNKRGK